MRDWSFLSGWKRAARDVAYLKRLNPRMARVRALRFAAIYATAQSAYWQGYVRGILSAVRQEPKPPVAVVLPLDLFEQFEALVAA